MKTVEHRYYPLQVAVEERAEGAGLQLRGYAAVFNQEVDIWGLWREVMRPGAFQRAIAEGDVRALFNHDRNLVLGRTKSGSLRLREDERGLAFEIDLPETSVATDLHKLVGRGDVDQCSIGFRVMSERYTSSQNKDELDLREILEVELYDVGPVTFAAYPMTEVEARSQREAWRDQAEEESAPEVGVSEELRRAIWLEEQRCRLALAVV